MRARGWEDFKKRVDESLLKLRGAQAQALAEPDQPADTMK
jgi:hypothetical protein